MPELLLTPAEDHILGLLERENRPMLIKQITPRVPYSEIYVRKILAQLENKSLVYKTDTRQPYQYKPMDREKREEAINRFVQMLNADEELPNTPSVIKEIRKVPIDDRVKKTIPVLQQIIEAIKLADTDESRIPTL